MVTYWAQALSADTIPRRRHYLRTVSSFVCYEEIGHWDYVTLLNVGGMIGRCAARYQMETRVHGKSIGFTWFHIRDGEYNVSSKVGAWATYSRELPHYVDNLGYTHSGTTRKRSARAIVLARV